MATPPALPAPASPDPAGVPPERGTPPGTPAAVTRQSTFSRIFRNVLPILGITAGILALAALAYYYGPKLWNRYKSRIAPTTAGNDMPVLVVDASPNTNALAQLRQLPITIGNVTGTNINVNFGGSQFVMNGGTIIGSKDFITETTNRYAERRGPAPAVDALPGITLPERKVVGPTQNQVTLQPGEYATIVRVQEKPGFQIQLQSPQGLSEWCKNHGELPTGTLIQNVAPCPVTFVVTRY